MSKGSMSEKICNMQDSAAIRALTSKPEFTCGRCGAKAHDAANLCDAVQIPEAGWSGD